jgi:hypothetical protein
MPKLHPPPQTTIDFHAKHGELVFSQKLQLAILFSYKTCFYFIRKEREKIELSFKYFFTNL